jgi:hypothetical protein
MTWEIYKYVFRNDSSKVYFFLVGGCDLPIGYFIPLTNRGVAFRCRIS